IGKEEIVLVEGFSRKSDEFLSGRTDTNKVTIIPAQLDIKPGDYVRVKINKATSATLFGEYLSHIVFEKNSVVLSA
ncbi:MAG: TRAM domain-containing protein, partial [Ignavibacterium sp.]